MLKIALKFLKWLLLSDSSVTYPGVEIEIECRVLDGSVPDVFDIYESETFGTETFQTICDIIEHENGTTIIDTGSPYSNNMRHRMIKKLIIISIGLSSA